MKIMPFELLLISFFLPFVFNYYMLLLIICKRRDSLKDLGTQIKLGRLIVKFLQKKTRNHKNSYAPCIII